jgi:hypothetical protein
VWQAQCNAAISLLPTSKDDGTNFIQRRQKIKIFLTDRVQDGAAFLKILCRVNFKEGAQT